MPTPHSNLPQLILAASLAFGSAPYALSQPSTPIPNASPKETAVAHRASGSFDVKLTPQPSEADLGHSRMSIVKQFHGALEASSKGEMLAAGTNVKGSAGYVAIELVKGSLDGHVGTFVLQHSGTMSRGVPQLSVTVVPDSGTGQLTGLTGNMAIIIADGKHSYDFQYFLPESP